METRPEYRPRVGLSLFLSERGVYLLFVLIILLFGEHDVRQIEESIKEGYELFLHAAAYFKAAVFDGTNPPTVPAF